jgi:hypothetical protein
LDGDEKLHNGDIEGENMVDVGVEVHVEDGGDLNSPTVDKLMFLDDGIQIRDIVCDMRFYPVFWHDLYGLIHQVLCEIL